MTKLDEVAVGEILAALAAGEGTGLATLKKSGKRRYRRMGGSAGRRGGA